MPPLNQIGLNRWVLSKIDNKLRSELNEEKSEWLVKVPASPAVRAVWKRYCDSVGIPMGHGLAVLLHNELASIVDEDVDTLTERLRSREAEIESRVRQLKDREKELRQRDRGLFLRETDLAEREKEVAAREHNVAAVERSLAQELKELASRQSTPRSKPKLGRNDLCWCNSGKKYKNCHLDSDQKN